MTYKRSQASCVDQGAGDECRLDKRLRYGDCLPADDVHAMRDTGMPGAVEYAHSVSADARAWLEQLTRSRGTPYLSEHTW